MQTIDSENEQHQVSNETDDSCSVVTSPYFGVKDTAVRNRDSKAAKITHPSDGMIALALSGKGSFHSNSSYVPIPTILILNPAVRLTVYKYLDDTIVKTKICSLSRRERHLLQAVAATKATQSTLQRLM